MKRQFLYVLAVVCFSLSFFSCNQRDDTPVPDVPDAPHPQITVITSLSGLGDNGYNDLIISGVFAATNGRNVDLSVRQPYFLEIAEEYMKQWVEKTADRDSSLLILAGDDFDSLINTHFSSLTSKQRVLVIDGEDENWPNGVYGFKMQRYGCSYLAACIAQYEDAEIWAATKGKKVIEDAISGFQDGMKVHSGRQCRLSYIADNESGFEMQDSVYRKMKYMDEEDSKEEKDIVVRTIYPLLGNSINGIIRFLNAQIISCYMLVGMDTDMAMLSNSVPFSVVNHVDRVTSRYITDWLAGKEWERKHSYGLASGMMEVVLSPDYYYNILDLSEEETSDNIDAAETRGGAFLVYPGPNYVEEGVFGKLLEQYKEEAVRKEEIYEKK